MASLPAHPRFSLPHLTLRARPSAKPQVDAATATAAAPTDDQNRRQAALRLQAEDRARRETSVAPPRS
ncbi:MAG TPA: hypothetical protein VGM33_10765 [Baekduia sp.]|jgi:hypothetical protein